MPTQNQFREQALHQIEALATLAGAGGPPIRPDAIDAGLTYGLGIIGLWAVLDAFLDRVGYGGRTLPERLSERVSAELVEAAKELEDVRLLYSQNFAGTADEPYLTSRRRYVIRNRQPRVLGSGATFNGRSLQMNAAHFHWYVTLAQSIAEQVRL